MPPVTRWEKIKSLQHEAAKANDNGYGKEIER